MKIIRKKSGILVVLVCLLACFLFSAWGGGHINEPGIGIPSSEIQHDPNANHIYIPFH